ncbi:hypothetical protein N3K66_002467 [Trichothecium roseum]|uniref:Uncharacterized protein n=1 Tax=Trichothecium roseum TaxID=47278 RepID=A0ACC0V9N4_9HYPO|nr:hypothetical protein N3K66_002467 [Trichothecium roseum]
MNTLSAPSENDVFGEGVGSADGIGSGDGHDGIGGQNEEIPEWTDQDRICARLFESWPELPVEPGKPVEETLGLLAKLDHHIHHFEVAIGRSDAGFRAERRRLAGLRFEHLVGGITYDPEQLFGRDRADGSGGDNPDGGAAGTRRSKRKNKGNRCYVPLREPGTFWWWPLGALLTRRAAQLRSDGRVLRALF